MLDVTLGGFFFSQPDARSPPPEVDSLLMGCSSAFISNLCNLRLSGFNAPELVEKKQQIYSWTGRCEKRKLSFSFSACFSCSVERLSLSLFLYLSHMGYWIRVPHFHKASVSYLLLSVVCVRVVYFFVVYFHSSAKTVLRCLCVPWWWGRKKNQGKTA